MGKDTAYKFRVGDPAGNRLAWDGTDLTLVANTVSIGSTGIQVNPYTTSDIFNNPNAYSFAVTSGTMGLSAFDSSLLITRRITLKCAWTGAGTYKSTIDLIAQGDASTIDSISIGRLSGGRGTGIALDSTNVLSGSMKIGGVLSVQDAGTTKCTIANTGDITTAGMITVSGFGTHVFSSAGSGGNIVRVQNTTNGSAASALFDVTNDAGVGVSMQAFASSFTPGGDAFASGARLIVNSAGGLSITTTNAAGEIRFYTGGFNQRARFDTNGDFVPGTDNTRNCGVPSDRWALVRGVTITSGDLNFENGWTFTEGEKVGIAEPGIALLDETGTLVAFFGRSGIRGRGGVSGLADADDLPYVPTTAAQRAQMDRQPELRTKAVLVPVLDAKGAPVLDDAGQPKTREVFVPKTTADVLPFPAISAAKSNRQRPIGAVK